MDRKYDLVILTEERYWKPQNKNDYINNVLLEDRLLLEACEDLGMHCLRLPWSHPNFDWSSTKAAIFRTTWDYFDKFKMFSAWLEKVKGQTRLINPADIIEWNLDKHYLIDLRDKGIAIPPTYFIHKGDTTPLTEHIRACGWKAVVLKPAISGAGRHTYKLNHDGASEYESIFNKLVQEEDLLLQKFISSVPAKGEVSFMMIKGRYTHAILKKAKPGDFRVQDDFGGSVHEYIPGKSEIEWAEKVFHQVIPLPIYGRVDAVWDENNELCVSELELIEPEMWFRYHPKAAGELAKELRNFLQDL